jgi:hypothetical protein
VNKKEGLQNNNGNSVVEIVALVMERKLNKEDLSPENQTLLEFYLGIIPDDPKFAAAVNNRRKQMINTEGQRTSLFPEEVIENISKRKKKRKQEERLFQPSLWTEDKKESELIGGLEPRDMVMEVGKELNGRFTRNNRLISEEIKYKKETLRNEIGLPIVRGKDPHVKDMFYKFLVNNICNWDRFGIFNENDRVWVERDEELNVKIGEVKGLVDELLNDKKISRQERFRRYKNFLDDYKNRWGE